jgi:anti-anti-sigma regulatory factor
LGYNIGKESPMIWIKWFLFAPTFEGDEDKTYIAGLVNSVLLTSLAGVFLLLVAGVAGALEGVEVMSISASILLIVIFVVLKVLLHRGHTRFVGIVLSFTIWATVTVPIFAFDGIRDVTLTGYFVVIAMTSLVLGGRTLLIITLLSSVAVVVAFYAERSGAIANSLGKPVSSADLIFVLVTLNVTAFLSGIIVRRMSIGYARARRNEEALEKAYAETEGQVKERTAELEREIEERTRMQEENLRLQQEMIEAQQRAIQELSAPIIPVLEGVIIMPLIGSIDASRARDITRSLLVGIRQHSAKVVILDITGVPIVDSGVAAGLNKTVQAARLKGARTIITGVSEAVAETIVDLGIDWSGIETLGDLRTGLRVALSDRG